MIQAKQAGSLYAEFPELKTFTQNICARHPEYGSAIPKNLDLIQSIDMNGNVTEEHYGMNLVTDIGADEIIFDPNNESYQLSLYEGASTAASVLDYAQPTYTRKINNTSSDTAYTTYPATYDSTTGIISQAEQWIQWTFDYNYDGIDTDMTVNCITYNPKTTTGGIQYVPILKITTYDVNGMEAPLIKHINEKLVITMFSIGTIHESLLIDGYDNGHYIAMNPARMARTRVGGNGYVAEVRTLSSLWDSYNTSTAGGTTYTYKTLGNMSYGQKYMNMHGEQGYWVKNNMSYIMSDPRVYMSRTEFRLGSNWSSGFSDGGVITWQNEEKLSQPEEIVCESVFTNSFQTGDMGDSFGLKRFETTTCAGIIPVTDFSISSVKGYNYTTHAWDIDIPFTDAPYAYYDNPTVMNHTNLGIETGWDNYIYIHPRAKDSTGRPGVAIAGFKKTASGATYTMYATDKYWDRSSWELISNIGNIPTALQKKKYYISVGGSNSDMGITYDQQTHSLNVGSEYAVQNAPTDFIKSGPYGFRSLVDLTNGWILAQEHLMFMNGNDVQYSYRLTGPEFYPIFTSGNNWAANNDKYYLYQNDQYVLNTDPTYNSRNTYYTNEIDPYTIRYGFGDKILVGTIMTEPRKTYPTAVRLYTITSPSTAPTYQDIQIDTNTTDRSYPGIYSASENGFFVIQDQNTHCANIINVEDGTLVKLEDVELCFAINYTDYCVYKVSGSTPTTFNVYDMSTNTVHASFTIPDAYANITYIMGWNGYFYIKSVSGTSDYVHMYNIHDGSLTLLDSASFTIPNTLITDRTTSTNTGESAYYRINQVFGLMFSPDVMVINQPRQSYNGSSDNFNPIRYIKSDSPEITHQTFKHGTYSERPIESRFESNVYDGSGGEGRLTTTLVHAVQSVSQSKLLLVDTLGIYYSSSSTSPWAVYNTNNCWASVVDFGIAVDTEEQQNACYKHYTVSNSTDWHGGLIYWNNGIIRMTDTEMTWRPLDWFLPHKVTGTTYTIQAYNNPKKLGGKEFTFFKTNRGATYQHAEPPRSTGDIQMVFKHETLGYNNGSEQGFIFMKRLQGEVYGPDACDVAVPSGTTIRIEVEPVEGFEFLVGTFKWYLKGLTLTETDSSYSFTTNWTSSVATADDKDQTNGTSITTTANANILGVIVATSSSTIPWLMPTMIKGIKITTDPHIST